MKKISRILMLFAVLLLMGKTMKASDIDPEKSTSVEIQKPELINDGDPEPDVYWYFIRMRMDSNFQRLYKSFFKSDLVGNFSPSSNDRTFLLGG